MPSSTADGQQRAAPEAPTGLTLAHVASKEPSTAAAGYAPYYIQRCPYAGRLMSAVRIVKINASCKYFGTTRCIGLCVSAKPWLEPLVPELLRARALPATPGPSRKQTPHADDNRGENGRHSFKHV